jgi:hypothetical protein
MKITAIVILLVLFGGCATSSEPEISGAVSDYIVAAELQEQDSIRTMDNYSYHVISQRYVTVETKKEDFLLEFVRRCHELDQYEVVPDYRYEKNILRSRFDTIRGCRIGKIYSIDKGQAEELRNLGKPPGD